MSSYALIDEETRLKTPGIRASLSTTGVSIVVLNNEFSATFRQFLDLTQPLTHSTGSKHSTKHHILATRQFTYTTARRLRLDKLKIAKQ